MVSRDTWTSKKRKKSKEFILSKENMACVVALKARKTRFVFIVTVWENLLLHSLHSSGHMTLFVEKAYVCYTVQCILTRFTCSETSKG